MKREFTIIPKIKIHPSRIITYNEIHWYPSPPIRKDSNRQNTTLIQKEVNGKIELIRVNTKFLNSKRVSNGDLSKPAKKKLKLSIEYLLLLNKPQNGKSGNTGRHYNNTISFVTLTLPSKQIHDDNVIKSKCLNQFIIELHKYHGISNYVWRSERQKNGNLHFHILINRFIPYNDIRVRWNRIIDKLGYVTRYAEEQQEFHKDGFRLRKELIEKWSGIKQFEAYERGRKSEWKQPNSTDIHSIKNITNIKAYIIKYMSKSDQAHATPNPLEETENYPAGRIWGASVILSNIQGATAEIDSKLEKHLKNIEEHFSTHIYRQNYFTIIDITLDDLHKLKCKELELIFFSYAFKALGFSYQFET
jgi:hypothetical protein